MVPALGQEEQFTIFQSSHSLAWAFSTMVTMTSLTATFQAVPMLGAQGDCDIKSSICCFMLKGNQGELELIRRGAGSSFA